MEHTEKTVRKNYVYQGKILKLRCDDAALGDGTPCKREIVEHSGGACVLYAEDGRILFVRQYRYAYGESVLELPAGKLNEGEAPALAAARELEEETGVRAARLELLYAIYPTPGYTDEIIYLYRAYGGENVAAHPDEGEFLDVCWIEEAEAKRLLKSGGIKDGKTLVALLHYFSQK